jgi:hypothetical protein
MIVTSPISSKIYRGILRANVGRGSGSVQSFWSGKLHTTVYLVPWYLVTGRDDQTDDDNRRPAVKVDSLQVSVPVAWLVWAWASATEERGEESKRASNLLDEGRTEEQSPEGLRFSAPTVLS